MKRSDAGFTLLETLVAVALLSISVVIIAGGMGVSVFASNRHREQAEGHALLLQAAENIRSFDVPQMSCADHTEAAIFAAYRAGALGTPDPTDSLPQPKLPAGWTAAAIEVTDVGFYDGSGFADWLECPDNGDPDDPYRLTLQLVTLEVRDPSGHDVERLNFVKVGQQ